TTDIAKCSQLSILHVNVDYLVSVVFFFQAEDGIRDFHVTGVQTCALPIWRNASMSFGCCSPHSQVCIPPIEVPSTSRRCSTPSRSEERRVGKECRSRWSADPYKKNKGKHANAQNIQCQSEVKDDCSETDSS